MKVLIFLITLVGLFSSCANAEKYVFNQKYCDYIIVGGVVGMLEKCFEKGDTITKISEKMEK